MDLSYYRRSNEELYLLPPRPGNLAKRTLTVAYDKRIDMDAVAC